MSKSGSDPSKIPSNDDLRQRIEALAPFMKPKREKKAVSPWHPSDREIQFQAMTSEAKQHLLERQIRHDIIQHIIQSLTDPSIDETP